MIRDRNRRLNPHPPVASTKPVAASFSAESVEAFLQRGGAIEVLEPGARAKPLLRSDKGPSASRSTRS